MKIQTMLVGMRNNSAVTHGLVSVLSLGVGSVSGYLLVRNRVETKYALLAQQEIAEAKRFYATVSKDGIEPEDLTREYAVQLTDGQVMPAMDTSDLVRSEEIVRDMRYHTEVVEVPAEAEEELIDEVTEAVEEVVTNFFHRGKEIEFDIEREMQNRDPDVAYIVSHDEYFEASYGFEQAGLTYFEGDDTLVDAKDDVIPDINGVVGGTANLAFGYGSRDDNVVYIRNERLELDFTVTRSHGKYSVEVLNFDDPDEIKHSDRPRIGKFRDSRADG